MKIPMWLSKSWVYLRIMTLFDLMILKVAEKKITEINTRLSSAEATWQMAENLYRQLADQVREHDYDIKDLNR